MSQENVEQVKRDADAVNRRDIKALLESLGPRRRVEPGVSGAARGRGEGVPRNDRVVAIGCIRTRGKASGAATESPFAFVSDLRDGKATRVRTYLDPMEALEAAGLSE